MQSIFFPKLRNFWFLHDLFQILTIAIATHAKMEGVVTITSIATSVVAKWVMTESTVRVVSINFLLRHMGKAGVCFSMLPVSFFFFRINAGGKKNTKCRKNTSFEQVFPDPDKHKWAHNTPTVNRLVTQHILTPIMIIHTLQSTRLTHFVFISVFGINRRACVSGFHFLQKKINVGLVLLQCMCVRFSPKWGKSIGTDNEKHQ